MEGRLKEWKKLSNNPEAGFSVFLAFYAALPALMAGGDDEHCESKVTPHDPGGARKWRLMRVSLNPAERHVKCRHFWDTVSVYYKKVTISSAII